MAVLADMYRCAVGMWGIQPSEFWAMDSEEWWWIYDAHQKPKNAPSKKYAGGLTEADCAELDEWLTQDPDLIRSSDLVETAAI